LGDHVAIFGGTAGDQWRFTGTYQFHGTELLQDAMPFLLFGEGVVFSFGVDTGWRPIGREGRITEVDGQTVRTIDGQPATAFYREFLGDADISQLAQYPLAVTADDGRAYFLRAPGGTDEATGSIRFQADVPDAARVHITTTNRDQILAATSASFRQALHDFPKGAASDDGKPALALCISCAVRKQMLGSRTQEEGRIVSELGSVPAVGFYGYGEIARLEIDGIPHYHNETFTTLLLGGRSGSA
jgi:hypothetical protein